jgi:uncharacterized protein (TIGR02246 family)
MEPNHSEIERLFNDFSWHADRGDGLALAALFATEGVLYVGGQELTGHKQIADDMTRRALIPGRKTRHVWSNLRIVESHENQLSTAAIQLTFEETGDDRPTQLRVSDLIDTLQKDNDGRWRFARRIISRQMALAFAG